MNRTDLLNEIYAGRTRLEAALQKIDPARMTEPALPGGWSVKDLLAHLGWWERRMLEIYQESLAGLDPSRPQTADAVDELNARTLAEFRARDLDSVREYERQAYHDVLEMVETAPEADLFDPERFPWLKGRGFVVWVNGNTDGHYDEHIMDLLALAPGALPVHQAVRRAAEFLDREGRDIDRVLFGYAFRGVPAEEVLRLLSRYQMPDGGFTRLEFDIAAPVSNPFAVELALRILLWIDPPRDHPVVQRALAYLEETQDEEGNWRFPPEVYQHALAPWFQGWQWPNLNPSGQIAGALKRLGLGSDRLHARVQGLFERQAKPEDLVSGDFYVVMPYAQYLQTEWSLPLAEIYRSGATWWLVRQHYTNPKLDATHFMELAAEPSLAVPRRVPAEVLNAKLDQLIDEQSEDGGWPSPYSPAWRSWITAQNALILRAYGKV